MLPLILLHGYPFDGTLWKDVASFIGPDFQVFAPDLPGFGQNHRLPVEPSIESMADDVAHFLQRKQIRHGVVAGMSMGGYVALAFAERHPKMLAGLGLISTHAWADTDEIRRVRRKTQVKAEKEGPLAAIEGLLPKLFFPSAQENEAFRNLPIAAAQNAGVECLCWALEAMARRPDRSKLLMHLSMPALVMHGKGDQIIPVERAQEMARHIPNADWVEVQRAGHVLPLEAPDIVAHALTQLAERASRFSPETGLYKRDKEDRGIVIAPTEHGL